MPERPIPFKTPATIELEPGTYYWCRCGRSQNQPFCDGSHRVTEYEPMEFKVEKRERVKLCRCKRTKAEPICDNTHREL